MKYVANNKFYIQAIFLVSCFQMAKTITTTTQLKESTAFNDWTQDDVQIPAFRENLYYFEGRSVPITESYLHKPVAPLNCNVAFLKHDLSNSIRKEFLSFLNVCFGKGDLSIQDGVSGITDHNVKSSENAAQTQPTTKPQKPKIMAVLPTNKGVTGYLTKKRVPALTYENALWSLKIRKELFYPNESVDDEEMMSLIFWQIVNDCKQPNPFRVRPRDRDLVINQLSELRRSFKFLKSPNMDS